MASGKKEHQTITARKGETLCTLAAMAGFLDCNKLRAQAENSGVLKATMAGGEHVVIPPLDVKDVAKGTEIKHKFTRKGVPVAGVRFVHGSKNLPYASDKTLEHLEVSNFVCNQGGHNGTDALSTSFGFHDSGDADPDTFKIEVVDPGVKGGEEVEIELEALRPVYTAKVVTGHDHFPHAADEGRLLKIKCKRIKAGQAAFRSRYLRLIVDEADRKTLSGDPIKVDGTPQGLFVSDTADGNGGVADQVEILDQLVNVTYHIKRCKAAANKCTMSVEVPISPTKRRIALSIHVFRKTAGGTPVGGANDATTTKNLRRRMSKWYRRTYAQAGFAPVLVDPKIEFLNPPGQDMIVLSEGDGTRAAGDDGTGTRSSVTLTLGPPPSSAGAYADATFSVNLSRHQTPISVGNAIAAAVTAGFSAAAGGNPVAIGRQFGSCDVIFSRGDGKPVAVKAASTDDTALTIQIVTVNVDAVDGNATPVAGGDADIAHNPQTRRLIRSFHKPAEDRLDCFIIGSFAINSLRGRAWTPDLSLPEKFRAKIPLRYAAIMAQTSSSGAVMDGGDNLPFTFPHESGHVLHDTFHADDGDPNGRSQLMASGTSPSNAIGATRRICDSVKVMYMRWSVDQSTVGKTVKTAISAVERLHKRGKPMFRPW